MACTQILGRIGAHPAAGDEHDGRLHPRVSLRGGARWISVPHTAALGVLASAKCTWPSLALAPAFRRLVVYV